MIMFRIPIAQPPTETRKSERNGRTQWWARFMAKSSVQPLSAVGLYAYPTGKTCQSTANTQTRMIASHMYGVAVRA